MKNSPIKTLVLVLAATAVLVGVLSLSALGLGVAYGQDTVPNTPFTSGGMMGGMMGGRGWQGGSNGMGAMHGWMSSTGGMHNLVWNTLAATLGLTTDELYAELNGGKTLVELAEEKGLERADLTAALEAAHRAGLAQAVAADSLTQDQADAMLAAMAGRYEWMIDHMGAGAGMMGGYGGMMGGNGGMMGGGACPHGRFGQTAPDASGSTFAPPAARYSS